MTESVNRSNNDLKKALFWVLLVIVAPMLSIYATWVAINRLPVPDNNAISLGLFFFFLIMFLDLLFLGILVANGLRTSKGISIAELGLLFVVFVGGLVAAAFAGFLPWGIDRLVPDRLGVEPLGIATAFFLLIFSMAMISSAIREKQPERRRITCWHAAGLICFLLSKLSEVLLAGDAIAAALTILGVGAFVYTIILMRRMRSSGSTFRRNPG